MVEIKIGKYGRLILGGYKDDTHYGWIDYHTYDWYIYPILNGLWEKGIETVDSCAGHDYNHFNIILGFKYNENFINYLKQNNIKIIEKKDSWYIIINKNFNKWDHFWRKRKPIDYHKKLKRDRLWAIIAKFLK